MGISGAPVTPVDRDGNVIGAAGSPTITQSQQNTYTLANNVAVGANGNTTPVAGVRGGVYVWDAQWTGAATVKLQALGADGATWRDVASLAAPGTFAGEVRIGANASLRLNSSAAITALSATLS